MKDGRVFPSLRDAIHATATGAKQPMKALAADLDWSPTELSMRTTPGGDSARPFPADDDHLVKLMRLTGDYSILATLADLCGFELSPKRERLGEMVQAMTASADRLVSEIKQLTLAFAADQQPPGPGSRKR